MVNQIPILHMLEAVKPVLAVVTGAALVMPKIALVMSLIYMHVAKLCGIIARGGAVYRSWNKVMDVGVSSHNAFELSIGALSSWKWNGSLSLFPSLSEINICILYLYVYNLKAVISLTKKKANYTPFFITITSCIQNKDIKGVDFTLSSCQIWCIYSLCSCIDLYQRWSTCKSSSIRFHLTGFRFPLVIWKYRSILTADSCELWAG